MVNVVHHVWNRLLGKVGDGVNCSHLHLLVDGGRVHVERTTEDVWESYNVVYLVRIVGTSC